MGLIGCPRRLQLHRADDTARVAGDEDGGAAGRGREDGPPPRFGSSLRQVGEKADARAARDRVDEEPREIAHVARVGVAPDAFDCHWWHRGILAALHPPRRGQSVRATIDQRDDPHRNSGVEHPPRRGAALSRRRHAPPAVLTRLACAEINSSFHRPHAPETYAKWAASTPPVFRFAVKLPRTITHDGQLRRARRRSSGSSRSAPASAQARAAARAAPALTGIRAARGRPLLRPAPRAPRRTGRVRAAARDVALGAGGGVARAASGRQGGRRSSDRARRRTARRLARPRATSGCTARRGSTGPATTTGYLASLAAALRDVPRRPTRGACSTTPRAAQRSRTPGSCNGSSQPGDEPQVLDNLVPRVHSLVERPPDHAEPSPCRCSREPWTC